MLTLFRGALFTWAVEEMSEEALRADLRKVAGVVVSQREIWNTATSGSGGA